MSRFIAISIFSAVSIASSSAWAQAVNIYSFDVKPGPISDILRQISAQADITLKIDQASTGLTFPAHGVRGRHSVRAAIDIALRKTGWHLEQSDGGVLRIVNDADSSQDIIVTAASIDFLKDSSNLATRTLTPIHDTPGTIDAVTKATLDSQNAIGFAEALRNIPGVTVFGNALTGANVSFGPDSNTTTFVDGMRVNSNANNATTVTVESVEVLKGPASILTGSAIAGGVVNYVQKKATGTSVDEITLGVGSGTEVTATADIGGAISRRNGLFYRIVGLSQYADHLVDGFNNPHDRAINGMLGYRSEHTTIDLAALYEHQLQTDQNYYYFNTVTNMVDPWGAAVNKDSYRVQALARFSFNAEQDIVSNDDFLLKLRARGKYEQLDSSSQTQVPNYISGNNQTQLLVNFGLLPNGTAFVTGYARTFDSPSYSLYSDLYARFDTGPLRHQLIVAGDLFHQTYDLFQRSAALVTPIGQTPSLLPLDPTRLTFTGQFTSQKGVIVQDLIDVWRFHILGAGRWSWYEDRTTRANGTISSRTKQDKFSPNAGIVFDVSKAIALYYNYANAFTPRSSSFMMADGSIVPPTQRKQMEAGVKILLPGGRFAINGSAFKYKTNNTPIFQSGFYVVGPGQKAKGLEISATGNLGHNLDLTAGYTYTSSKTTTGAPVAGAPRNIANLWIVKGFDVTANQKLTIGLGGNYQSSTMVYDTIAAITGGNAYRLLDRRFFSINTAIGYRIGKSSLNLTVDNILDRFNLQTPYDALYLQSSTPRRFRLVFRQQF